LDELEARVDTIQQNIDSMQVQIGALVLLHSDYETYIAGLGEEKKKFKLID